MQSQSVQEAAAHPSTRWRSLSELLDSQAARTASAPAVSFPTGQLSYGELAAETQLAARRLRACGVGPGDRVGILLREGCVPYVTFGLGAMRLGAMCVPINARNKTHELSYVMQHADPRVLITSSEFEELVRDAGLPEGCELLVLGDDGELADQPDEVPAEEVAEIERGVDPDTRALLLYTSGTTANPKGVVHTHATLIAVGYNTSERLELASEDRYWTALAMFHVGGWQVLASALAVGACFSHVGFYNAGSTLDQLERERVTVAMPAFELIWMGVLDHPRFAEADLSALRLVMNVGVPERMERMQQMLPQAVQVSMVGMTESAGSICIGSIKDSLYSRTHTSGRPLRGMEVRVIDPATGEECPRGVPGELAVPRSHAIHRVLPRPRHHGQRHRRGRVGAHGRPRPPGGRRHGGVHEPAQGHAQGRGRERLGGGDRGLPDHPPGCGGGGGGRRARCPLRRGSCRLRPEGARF